MSERYWFRPKSFGYGATPLSWEGWTVTFVSLIVTMSASLIAVFAEIHKCPDRRVLQAACLVVLVTTLIATIIVSRLQTKGRW
jgi:hypothetical protein